MQGLGTTHDLIAQDAVALAGIEGLRFFPLEVVSGSGSWLTEPGGRRLLDLSTTWTAWGLGHGDPTVRDSIVRAAQNPPGAGGLSAVHPDSVRLAEDLLALTPRTGDRRVYLGHAGSDANDVALRACRLATGRNRIVAFEHSFHGGVGVAMGMSGVHVDAGAPEDPWGVFRPFPDPLRPHTGGSATVVADSLRRLEIELADDVACLIVEPILADGGLVVPPDGFLTQLVAVAGEYQVLVVGRGESGRRPARHPARFRAQRRCSRPRGVRQGAGRRVAAVGTGRAGRRAGRVGRRSAVDHGRQPHLYRCRPGGVAPDHAGRSAQPFGQGRPTAAGSSEGVCGQRIRRRGGSATSGAWSGDRRRPGDRSRNPHRKSISRAR